MSYAKRMLDAYPRDFNLDASRDRLRQAAKVLGVDLPAGRHH